jgi:hypothetical protein
VHGFTLQLQPNWQDGRVKRSYACNRLWRLMGL